MEQLEEYHGMSFILLGPKPDRVKTGVVSSGFFPMLGVKPIVGRTFRPSDDELGAPAVLVLSNRYWKTMFGGDPNVIGRTVKMNDKLHTIVGVLPPIPQYPRDNDVYMPVSACPFRMNKRHLEMRTMRMMELFGRLKPGVPVERADAEMRAIQGSFAKEFAADYPASDGLTASATTLQHQLTYHARPMLLLLMGMTGLVLLICCTNVANLALARMIHREREFAIRSSLGASRGRLARQMLTESVLLALAGGALGLLLASASLDLLVQFVGRFTSRAAGVGLSAPVLFFTLGLSIVSGLLFGLLPALSAGTGISGTLKTAANTMTGDRQRHAMRSGLIIAQVALSFVMLSAAGLMIRTLLKLQRVDAGYHSDHILTARLPYNFTKLTDADKVRSFEERLIQELDRVPGVHEAALASAAPLDQSGPNSTTFKIEGRTLAPNQATPITNVMTVTPSAFSTLEIPLVRGRLLSVDDGPKTPEVTVISRSLARHYFGNEDPIGKRISGDEGKTWTTIVGIVGDVRQFGLDHEPVDTAYVPAAQQPGTGSVLLRTQNDPRSVANLLRLAINRVDPEQPVVEVKTLDELRDDSLAATRVTAVLLALFAAVALVIAATGLAGVTSYLVSQRTREIGIRIALGAQVRQVLSLVLSHGVKLIVIGAVVGITLAVVCGRALENILFGVKPVDWPTLVGVAMMLMGVSLVASYIPARRATRVEPLAALRYE
jgi:predicted permease